MKKFLAYTATSALIYLGLALLLTIVPVARDERASALDASSLSLSGSSGREFKETYFRLRDGRQIYSRLLEGESTDVLVLLHGSGSEGRYLRELAEAVNSSHVTVYVPDLRGHGRSMTPGPGDVSHVGQLVDDLADILSTIRKERPLASVLLGGHSSGGGLAVRFAAENPDGFDAYVLIAPYLGHRSVTVRPNSGGWVQVSTRRYAGLSMLNNVHISYFNSLPVLFFNRPESWDDDLQVEAYSYRMNESISPTRFDADLGAIAAPTLILVGEQDEALYAERFVDVAESHIPEARLVLLPDIGHMDIVASRETFEAFDSWLGDFGATSKTP